MLLKDYVVFYLTGKKLADMSIATFSFYFDLSFLLPTILYPSGIFPFLLSGDKERKNSKPGQMSIES